jgi:hypothetical protein
MPTDFEKRVQKIYETCIDDLITPFEQRTMLGEHDQGGLCLGLAFNWVLHRLRGSAFPVVRLDERKARFDQAFGNLQAWAAKGHLPTGRAASMLRLRDGLFASKPVVPDQDYQPDVRIYDSDHFHHVSVDLGTQRQELGQFDASSYHSTVLKPALKEYKLKLARMKRRFGTMTPRLPDDIVCVGSSRGDFGSYSPGFLSEEKMLNLLRTKQADFLMKMYVTDKMKDAFVKGFNHYRQNLRDLAHGLNAHVDDPFTWDVCAIFGWLWSRTGSAHAVALSYSESFGSIRYFDPNMGDFAFFNWDEFVTWHSAMYAGMYRGKQYQKWDMELYTREPQ